MKIIGILDWKLKSFYNVMKSILLKVNDVLNIVFF